MNRTYEIELSIATLNDLREEIRDYSYEDSEWQALSQEIGELVEELNNLEAMTDEDYEREHEGD
jgi:hypothetical protein